MLDFSSSSTHARISIHTYIHTYLNLYTYTYTYTYTYIYTHAYTYTSTYTYTYTYTYNILLGYTGLARVSSTFSGSYTTNNRQMRLPSHFVQEIMSKMHQDPIFTTEAYGFSAFFNKGYVDMEFLQHKFHQV